MANKPCSSRNTIYTNGSSSTRTVGIVVDGACGGTITLGILDGTGHEVSRQTIDPDQKVDLDVLAHQSVFVYCDGSSADGCTVVVT